MKQYHTSENSNNQSSGSPEPLSLVLPDRRSRDRRNYDNELEAHARYYEGQGEPESSSWQMAADDLGDFTHWLFVQRRRVEIPRRRARKAPAPIQQRTHALNARSEVTA